MTYTYFELAHAIERVSQLVNVWAVVLECSVPRQTRGTDLVCNLTLVDPSTPERPDLADGIEMLCFAASAGELPHLHRPGDIIRLHRVKIQRYNDRPQLVGKLGFRGSGFAYCLFDAAAPDAAAAPAPAAAGGPPPASLQFAPYQSSSQYYHYDEREEALLSALRNYLTTLNRAQLGGNTHYLRRIKDVRPMEFFDCVCRVVAVDDSDASLRLLHVWDASDALPFPAAFDTRDREDTPEAQRIHPHLRPFALPIQDMPELSGVPLLGTALPVVFLKNGRMETAVVGSWVKLRNLGARVVGGQLQAYYHRNSRWMPWGHDEAGRREVEEEYRQRVAANHTAGWAPDPRGAAEELLALCRHRDRPLSTVRQVLMDVEAAVPRCYRLLVRLVDYTPRQPADMCSPAQRCGLPADLGRWVYTLKLLVEDATGQLDLVLFGPDADAFFPHLPARDMRTDPAAAEQLLDCLSRLMGQGCQRDGGPWMEVTVKAFYTDPGNPWQSRQYRIFDTTLTPPQQPAAGAG